MHFCKSIYPRQLINSNTKHLYSYIFLLINIQSTQMPRSPDSHDKGKRDYRYRDQSDRYYGGQTRKKVHREYYDNQHRQRSRKHDNPDDRTKRRQQNEQRPSICIEEKQLSRHKRTQPQSEIKVHFRFKPIKVNLESRFEQDLLKMLKTHVSSKNGQLEHFQKSFDSRPGYLVIEFGFKYDADALAYLNDKKSDIDLKIEKEKINITAEPTKVFKLLIDELEERKKRNTKDRSKSRSNRQKPRKRKHHSSSSQSRSNSSSKYSSSESKSRRSSKRKDDRRQDSRRKGQYKGDRKRSPDNSRFRNDNPTQQPQTTSSRELKDPSGKDESKKYRTLCFFGLHSTVNAKDMDTLFYNHEQGPFRHQQIITRRMKDSISQFMYGKFQQKDALKLLQIGEKMQVKGHPFIVFEAQSMEDDKLMEKLAQFQVNIEFPKKIEPYHLLKSMKQCGRVIQILANNKFSQEQRCEYYNITFNSRLVCDKLKKTAKTPQQIIIEQVTSQNALFVYRPNLKTELMSANLPEDEKLPSKPYPRPVRDYRYQKQYTSY